MAKTSKEKLHSHRQFFKKAAKSVLPILGAIVLSNMPSVLIAQEQTKQGGCKASCSNNCSHMCRVTCKTMCGNYCGGSCRMTCFRDGCTQTCAASCITTCMYSAKMTTDSIQNDTTIIKR